jgi:hypothetical protein
MPLYETPSLTDTTHVQSPSDARQLAVKWREDGAQDIFKNDGARLKAVGILLQDFAERPGPEAVRKTFQEEARRTRLRGRIKLHGRRRQGSIEGGPIC